MEIMLYRSTLYNDNEKSLLFFNDYIYKNIVETNQIWEENICREIVKHILFDTDFLDLGANIGLITLGVFKLLKETGKQIRTFHCVECSLRNIQLLRHNTGHLENVCIYPFALSNKTQVANMSESAFNTGCDHISLCIEPDKKTEFIYENYSDRCHKNPRIFIPCMTLDNIRHLFTNRVSVVKIDVEGFEYFILAGGLEWFREHKPAIILEVFDRNKQQVFSLLSDYGYTMNKYLGKEDYLFLYSGV
jgi:FkbM family methyltransferase